MARQKTLLDKIRQLEGLKRKAGERFSRRDKNYWNLSNAEREANDLARPYGPYMRWQSVEDAERLREQGLDLSPFWTDAMYPDKWEVPEKYRDVADEAAARYLSAHRAADAIQRDVDMYKEWYRPGHLYQGPKRDDIRFKDEKGIEHTPVYDPFYMVSPYYRRQLTDREYADLTNGL